MGQKFYVAVSYGRTPDEAFAEALLDAIEGGFDDIYSGTIGPKDSYRPDAGFSGDPNNAEEVAWRIADPAVRELGCYGGGPAGLRARHVRTHRP